jgi:hypothetical protein
VAGACGSISDAGVYTAPFSPPPGGSLSITATAKDNSVPASGAIITVQFGNGSLNGQYAFTFSGQNAGAPYLAAGKITFDGSGNIGAGAEDVGASSVSITGGTYHVSSDGRGNATLHTSGGDESWRFTVVNHAKALVIRFDTTGASGTLELQDTAAVLAGNYAFNLSGANASNRAGSLAEAGALTAGAGAISSGVMDVNSAGNPSTGLTITAGSFTAPTAGRGTLTVTTTFGTQTFAYYVVDANHVKVVETDAINHTVGDFFKQPAGPFANTSFRGGVAFAFLGSTIAGPLGEGGVLTFDGAGHVTAGTLDFNANGNPLNGQTVSSGTYTVVDANTGRATASLTVGGSTLQYALYPQINGGISMVEIDTANTVAGRALQQSGSFSGGTLSGNYALNLTGTSFNPPGEEDVAGQVVPNGGSAITGTLDINSSGVLASSQTLAPGSYSCTGDCTTSGRGSATLGASGFTPNGGFTFYIADSNNVFFLETDSTRVLTGTMQKQF